MRDLMKDYWWLGAIVLVGVIFSFIAMAPPPPKQLTFASGAEDGSYYQTATAYRDFVSEEGVTINILTSNGSRENIERLVAGEVDVALVQGGLVTADEALELRSIGAIFYEPLWVFVDASLTVSDFGDLRGLRLAIGPEGSGTRVLTEVLQAEWGGDWPAGTHLAVGGAEAARQLRQGEVDAAAFVSSIDSEVINGLIADERFTLLGFDRAPALARRLPYLGQVDLLRGVTNVGADLPETDIPLVAPAAQLVVRRELHPAIHALLVEAAHDIHRGGGLLAPAGVFPNRDMVDIPLSDQAKRYFENGPTFLRRVFSFGTANFLERAWILIIPLATLAYPLFKAAPPIYRWRTRRKIYIWYQDLRSLEAQGRAATSDAEKERIRAQLSDLQRDVGRVEVPLSYTDDLYRLRNHIAFVNHLLGNLDPAQETDLSSAGA